MILSFGWTSPALLAGAKRCTRREASERQARALLRQYELGRPLDAWNANPRVVSKHPHKIASILQTAPPEWSDAYPPEDWENEGFAWMTENGITLPVRGHVVTPGELWQMWLEDRPRQLVVRFAPLALTPVDQGVSVSPEGLL